MELVVLIVVGALVGTAVGQIVAWYIAPAVVRWLDRREE